MRKTRYTGVYEDTGRNGQVKIKIKYVSLGKQRKETLGIKGALIQRGNDELKLDAATASLIRADRISQVAREGEVVLRRNKPAPTFQEVWNSYSSINKDAPGTMPLTSWWNKYVSRWSDHRLDQVQEKDITDAIEEWETLEEYYTQFKKPPGYSTINSVKKFIMALYHHARDQQLYFGRVPISGAKRGQGRVKVTSNRKLNNERLRAFSVKEAKAILDWLQKHDHTCWMQCKLSLLTGARQSEICGNHRSGNRSRHHGLRWRDVDFVNKRITLLRKGGRYRTIPVSDEVIQVLKTVPVGAANARVTGPGFFKYRSWDKVREELNINPEGTDDLDRATFHTWRHTYGTWYINGGGNIKDLQYLLDHHDISVTARYIKSSTEGQVQGTNTVSKVLRDLEKEKFTVIK